MSEEFTEPDRRFMRLALRLARKGRGWTSPNPSVGAVVVNNGQVVGCGFSRPAGQRHAEFFALQEAGPRARGATLYSTLEPCCHIGRTPPCTEEIIEAGVKRVIASVLDPNPLVNGRGFERLRAAGIATASGLCSEDASRQMEDFLKFITTGLPFVTLKLATTLDGRIATRTGDSKWITSEASRRYVHQLRHEHDAVVVGINTLLVDDPELTARHRRKARNPCRVILDSQLRTPLSSKVLKDLDRSGAKTLVIGTRMANPQQADSLRAAGADVIFAPGRSKRVALPWLIRHLGQMGCTSILIEGGGEVAASALGAGLVDKVVWFIAAKIVGGKDAVPAVGGKGASRVSEAIGFKQWKTRRIGDDMVVEGYLKPAEGKAGRNPS
ncbi:MAG: bifunctional diaminohydroxyphosphoribosylaminopyrimidine deaminase/5-amino-6-(5-phosphoribosylamino)uracil reductase RibD [Armatimonadetes bacterium]|nr:bifunctional diaminohydroxyphosphoribosylaminopyrimidine deaminase/5-amino-6-(5-phosphoribosylamino)uracil reductase RibD [Armatimonadota bacterium]